MDKTASKTIKNENKLKFERDAQSSFTEDEGAFVSFEKQYSLERLLRISFGYESSGYTYTRDISLDFKKLVELKNFLDKIIEYQAMEQKSFYFFSYGSNLLYNRIHKRCNSVEVVNKLELPGFKLVFNKLSKKDGSAKANIVKTGNKRDVVWGVIHQISWNDKTILDDEEGLGKGYDLISMNQFSPETDFYHHVKAYLATDEKYYTNKKPYDWYLQLIIEGAKENDLPEDYIKSLKKIEVEIDDDECRKLKALRVINDDYELQYLQKCK